jgi:hypothetical protein
MNTDSVSSRIKSLNPTRDELLYMFGILIERVPEDVNHAMDTLARQRIASDMQRRSR